MRLTHRRTLALCAAAALALAAPAVAAAHGSGHGGHDDHHGNGLRAVKRIVVIYEENHSFDNLYGGWEGVNGLRQRRSRAHRRRSIRTAMPYACLLQDDVNLTTPPLRTCTRDSPIRATSSTRRSSSTTSSRRPTRRARPRASSQPTAC